jgi:hypothetical protein
MTRLLNNNKVLLTIIVILLITNIAMMLFCFCRKHCGRPNERSLPPKEAMSMLLKNEVKFTSEQMKQFDSLRNDHRTEIKPLFKKMNAVKDNFYWHMRDEFVEDSLFNSGLDSIALTQKMLDRAMFFHFRKIRMLCTPEQLPVYDSLALPLIKRMMNPYRKPERIK